MDSERALWALRRPADAVSLQDLPAHRREALLWQFALELDYDEVDDLVRESADAPCSWSKGPAVAAGGTAVLGDDGRYHLLLGERLACARTGRHRDLPGLVRHDQWCFWWSDGSGYRIQAPADAQRVGKTRHGKDRDRTVTWHVGLTDVVVDATTVAVRGRCVIGARQGWPGYLGPGTVMGRQRGRLVAELGPGCGACRRRPGTVVDHDHFTGLVRGLLCVHCNTWIDRCPHLTGCAWGDYLNHPPAAHLRLAYLRPERVGRSDRAAQKIDYLGFDPLYRGAADQRRRYPPRLLPAPPPHSVTDLFTSEVVPLF